MSDRANPATRWASVTPSNSVDFSPPPRALFVTGAGDLALVGSDDVVEVFPADANSYHPLGPKRVNSTGTTATGIKALY